MDDKKQTQNKQSTEFADELNANTTKNSKSGSASNTSNCK